MPKRLTPLTDPDNIMVVWDDEDEPEETEAPKRPAKKAVKKAAPKKRTGER